jgi:hypothetical protein
MSTEMFVAHCLSRASVTDATSKDIHIHGDEVRCIEHRKVRRVGVLAENRQTKLDRMGEILKSYRGFYIFAVCHTITV